MSLENRFEFFSKMPVRLVLLFISLCLFLTFFFVIFSPNFFSKPNDKLSYTVLDSGVSTFDSQGPSSWAVINFNHSSDTTCHAKSVWASQRPFNQVFILKHASVESDGVENFVSQTSRELSSYGFSVSQVSQDELSKKSDAQVIVPTGVFPEFLTDEFLSSHNLRVIFFGRNPEFLLTSSGTIIENKRNSTTFSDRIAFLGPSITRSKSQQSSELAVEHVLNARSFGVYSEKKSSFKPSGAIFFVVPSINGTDGSIVVHGFCEDRSNSKFYYASRVLSSPPGKLELPFTLYPESKPSALISFNKSFDRPVSFDLKVTAKKDGVEAYSWNFGTILIEKVFFTSIPFDINLTPGFWVFSVSNQYSEVLASAVSKVKGLEVSMVSLDSSQAVFTIKSENKPVDGETFIVRPIGKNSSYTASISSGFARVKVDQSFSSHELYEYSVGSTIGTVKRAKAWWEDSVYVSWGIPGLLLVILVFIFFSVRPSKMLNLNVPEFSFVTRSETVIKQTVFLKIFEDYNKRTGYYNMPLSLREIKFELSKIQSSSSKSLIVTDANLLAILDKLETSGQIKSFKGLYSLSSWQGSAEFFYTKKIVLDTLISKGLSFEISKQGLFFTMRDSNKILILCYENFSQSLNVLEGDFESRYIVFSSNETQEKFKSDCLSNSPHSALLSAAISNKKVLLILAKDLGSIL